MGCTASKLENEDTVRRCKDRRRLMKEAVAARHHLSAAHFDYLHSLRRTGDALLAFAAGENLQVHNHSPAVLLRTTAPPPKRQYMPKPPKPPTSPPRQQKFTAPHPPPPRQHEDPKPPSVASAQTPKNTSKRPETPLRTAPAARQVGRSKKPSMKLPHILSDSSFASSPPHDSKYGGYAYDARANSTYSATPSQTSSVWNWDNFYPPPSPPDSEYFNQLHDSNNKAHSKHSEDEDDGEDFDDKSSNFTSDSRDRGDNRKRFDDRASKASSFRSYSDRGDQRKSPFGTRRTASFAEYDDGASEYSSYSRYSHNQGSERRAAMERKQPQPMNRWESEEEIETEREEVQCSEWGDHDHYTSTSSSSDEEREDSNSRSEIGSARKGAKSFNAGEHGGGGGTDASSNIKSSYKPEKESSVDDGRSSVGWGKRVQIDKEEEEEEEEMNMERQIVVRHKDLAEIVEAIREYFNKAASAGEQVSEMLETGRAQLDRSFKQLKKTVYHSSGMLSSLSSSWTSKPPLAVKYRFEPGSIEESGGPKSLCSTLERLLAWEKKLYQEVKAREGVIIEHEKKLSALQSQEYKGEDNAKLDKTKASIKRLQSLISVTSQAAAATSASIVSLRDSDLVPQLVELSHGLMYMWRSMNRSHETQSHIVQQVKGLVNRSTHGGPTSDLHRQATKDLESAATGWHAGFSRLVRAQRDFVRALHGWFKLTMIDAPPCPKELPEEVFSFLDEWKLALERVPDTVASEAVKSFVNVVRSIGAKQGEEAKAKKRVEVASKELEKKASSLRSIERKYYHSYSMVGVGPDGPGIGPNGLDARDPLFEKKAEVSGCQRRVEEEMVRHAKAAEVTRAMTLNNIQTGLPGVFQAMTSFSGLFAEALQAVCTKSYEI